MSIKPKIFIFGNNTLGVECLEYLVKKGENVVGVCPELEDKGTDSWQRSFRKTALDLGTKIYNLTNINDKDFIQELNSLGIDYIFSFQCRRIFKKDLIKTAKKMCLNLHYALLPKYRGCYSIAWMLINNEKEGGVTLHFLQEEVDSGDILFQRKFKIPITMTAREFYDKCTKAGVKLLKESYPIIISEKGTEAKPQDNSQASYYSKGSIDFSKNKINWNNDYKKLHNWSRAFIFPPYQFPVTFFRNKKIEITKLGNPSDSQKSLPGEIIPSKYALNVSAYNGVLAVKEVRVNGEFFSALNFAKKYNIKIGDKFS